MLLLLLVCALEQPRVMMSWVAHSHTQEAAAGQDVPSATSWGWRELDLGSNVGAVLLGGLIWATPHPLLCNVQPRLISEFFCSFAIVPQHLFCLSCLIKFLCNIHKFKMGLKIPNNICCVTCISGSV